MTFSLAYCSLRWREPDLEPALETLKEVGWDGWECRLPLDWLGTPQRLMRICKNTDMPMVVYTAQGTPDNRERVNTERNKRRIEFAGEVGADCFMYMNGAKPKERAVTDDDVKAAAEGAEEWAEYAAQFDLELSYHIHTNLLVDNIEHWKLYMQHLDKAKLCIDVSHAFLWGYDPVESIRDFRDQLNYIHLQDYSSTSRRDDGFYDPIWCDVGVAESIDFPAVRTILEETNFTRWVTACPGRPIPGADDPMSEAKRSKGMVDYLRGIGY
ncbi:sugar phosphate isomerase/epimerase [Chloroflexi bacterium TSY]|nr:sugar phosphate isomerase/epimerase [Chloroflexi bacterium TSY]